MAENKRTERGGGRAPNNNSPDNNKQDSSRQKVGWARAPRQAPQKTPHWMKDTPDDAVLYGLHSVSAALENPARALIRLSATENAAVILAPLAKARDLEIRIERPGEITRLAPEGAVHQGALLTARPLPDADLETAPLTGPVLVLDRVTDPHNVGAVIRSAAAFGVSCLVTTKRFSPEATGVLAKAASGGLELVPWARETNLARALETLKERHVQIIGLEGTAETPLTAAADPAAVALVLGAEGKGLRQRTMETCDSLASIALPGTLKSLNVSNAAAIGLTILSGLGGKA